MAIRFLTRDEILEIHRDLLTDHGGVEGLRDPGLLDSALTFLDMNGQSWRATDDELVDLTLRVAEGRASKDEVATFFRSNCEGL